MHKVEFELIDAVAEIELIRLLDWLIANTSWAYGTSPPKGAKTLARHVRHQMLEGKRKPR
jgi:hypothetical protein